MPGSRAKVPTQPIIINRTLIIKKFRFLFLIHLTIPVKLNFYIMREMLVPREGLEPPTPVPKTSVISISLSGLPVNPYYHRDNYATS